MNTYIINRVWVKGVLISSPGEKCHLFERLWCLVSRRYWNQKVANLGFPKIACEIGHSMWSTGKPYTAMFPTMTRAADIFQCASLKNYRSITDTILKQSGCCVLTNSVVCCVFFLCSQQQVTFRCFGFVASFLLPNWERQVDHRFF